MSVVRLNHAVLFVSDLGRAADFYRDVLEFTTVSEESRFNAVFLRAADSDNHHDLGLFGLGPSAVAKRPGQTGLYHLAWQVPVIDDLVAIRERLAAAGGYTGESSHGATLSIYGADPDGNELEIMWLLPREAWGEYESRAVVEPLDLAQQLERWSGVVTA